MLGIRWIGRKEWERKLRDAGHAFPRALTRNVRLAGEAVIAKSQRQFKGSRTRALYKIKGGRRVTRKPPRAITSPPHMLGIFEGQYRKSITQEVKRKSRRRWTTEVGPEVPYARVHELGVGRMPKRQVLTPGVKKAEKQVIRILGRTFRVVG